MDIKQHTCYVLTLQNKASVTIAIATSGVKVQARKKNVFQLKFVFTAVSWQTVAARTSFDRNIFYSIFREFVT